MNIGIRAHDFKKQSVETLAKVIEENNFSSIQLALSKAIDNFDTSMGKLSPGLAYYIGNTFRKANVQVAILGCYVNMTHPDDYERIQLQNRFKEHIRFARDIGTSVVGTETGSLNADYSYTEKNESEEAFQIFVNNLRSLVEEAEKFGVIVGIEPVKKHIINTPQRMKRVLDMIDSNNVQVILDAVNLLSEDNYQEQDQIINECFELFGDRIVIIHAKDFVIQDGKIQTVAPGKGILNYELYLKHIKESKPYINILLEDIQIDEMAASKKYIEDIYKRV